MQNSISADAEKVINTIFKKIEQQIKSGSSEPIILVGTGFKFSDGTMVYIGYVQKEEIYFIGCKADDLKALDQTRYYSKHIWLEISELNSSVFPFSKLATLRFSKLISKSRIKFLLILILSNLLVMEDPTERSDLFILIEELKEIFRSYRGKSKFSKREQAAIFSEVYTLWRLMDYAKENGRSTKLILNYWNGPEHNEHDFYNNNDAIEVKSLTGKYDIIRIHSEYQLSSPDTGDLYLLAYRLKEEMQGDSLEDLINKIKAMMNPINFEELAFKLAKFKIAFDNLEQYSDWRYIIEKELFYKIDDYFPKINEEIIKNITNNSAITKIEYQISLDKVNNEPIKDREKEALLERFSIL